MNHDENQYLNLIKDITENGYKSAGRGGSFTRSLFGKTMEFSLENDVIPLFTTKKVFFRGVVEELLWILRGETNVQHLKEKKINIWNGHSSREFLDSRGLTAYPEGDIGPLYGFQLRHAGAQYVNCYTNYHNQGIDQLDLLINNLRNEPRSRRHVINMWNVADLDKMSLTPCHTLFQMYIDDKGLSCLLYQRSADVGLGVPFNVASYSILTRIIAQTIGVKAHKFIHQMGDVHIYEDHIKPIQEQVTREPFPFPTLKINKTLHNVNDIEQLQYEDFELSNYKYHKHVKMEIIL